MRTSLETVVDMPVPPAVETAPTTAPRARTWLTREEKYLALFLISLAIITAGILAYL
jgi:hypothetical protein